MLNTQGTGRTSSGSLVIGSLLTFVTGYIVAAYWVRHCITCDYDIAGLFEHLDRGGPIREYLPVVHLLDAPTMSLFVKLLKPVGQFSSLQAWIVMAPACVAISTCLMFLTCYRLTQQIGASLAGAAVFLLAGSTSYLARVQEDNQLVTPFLCIMMLALLPGTSSSPSLRRFLLAGLAWGMALLFGFYALVWLLFLMSAAAMAKAVWWHRLIRAAVSVGAGVALFLGVLMWLTPFDRSPPINPLTRLATGVPNAGLFAQNQPMKVRTRYVLLGTYQSLFALPADVAEETNTMWPQLDQGAIKWRKMHRLVAVLLVMLILLAIRAPCEQPVQRRFVMACAAALVGLTLSNFSAIDGSFQERFDHIPILLAPLVAALVAWGVELRKAGRLAGLGLVAAMSITTVVYGIQARDAGVWQYADMRALARHRRGNEPVVLVGDIAQQFDMDRLCMAASLWMGENDLLLLPTVEMHREGYYSVIPLPGLQDPAALRTVFEITLAHRESFLLNEAAHLRLEPILRSHGWTAEPILQGKDAYLRAMPVRNNTGTLAASRDG